MEWLQKQLWAVKGGGGRCARSRQASEHAANQGEVVGGLQQRLLDYECHVIFLSLTVITFTNSEKPDCLGTEAFVEIQRVQADAGGRWDRPRCQGYVCPSFLARRSESRRKEERGTGKHRKRSGTRKSKRPGLQLSMGSLATDVAKTLLWLLWLGRWLGRD